MRFLHAPTDQPISYFLTFAARQTPAVKYCFRILLVLSFFIALASLRLSAQSVAGRPVDVVFCMDLSSSSNGLIDHLRNNMWNFWYFFNRCKPQQDFRMGVVAYARFSYGKESGYSKVMVDLTTDFDKMSNTLFKVPSRIEKGDQYVGAALNTCLTKVNWSKRADALKVIILIGNGDVTTGTVDIDQVMDKIAAKNIIVHTVYCTVPGEKKAIKGWERIALRGRGKIATISVKNRYFDRLNGFDIQKFRTLNRKFNQTYLYYGKSGKLRYRYLQEADNNAYIANTEGYRYRSLYKISDQFQRKNDWWDLVDQYNKNPNAYLEVDKLLLNDSCKKMGKEQLKNYIITKKYERKKLTAMIAEMITNKELKDRADGIKVPRNMPTLDNVSVKLLRELLKANGCECPSMD